MHLLYICSQSIGSDHLSETANFLEDELNSFSVRFLQFSLASIFLLIIIIGDRKSNFFLLSLVDDQMVVLFFSLLSLVLGFFGDLFVISTKRRKRHNFR